MRHFYSKVIMLCIITISCFLKDGYNQKKLIILGSSTSACWGPANAANCYINRLAARYNTPNTTITIDNRAVGGFNIYKSMPTGYIPPADRDAPVGYYNITDALATNPDVLLINYPSNGYDIFSIAETMNCFRSIRQAAINAGKPIYITTTQPRSEFNAANREKLRILRDSILTVFGAFAIDFYTDLADPVTDSIATPFRVAGDNIHLNDSGHAVLYQRVYAKDLFLVNASLPLNFLHFKAETNNYKVVLNWSTALEKDLKNFDVYRSADGLSFSKLSEIAASNRAEQNNYSFTDNHPGNRINYYRITAVNKDRKPEHSKIIRVNIIKKGFSLEKVYVKSNSLFMEIQTDEEQSVKMDVTNEAGQVIRHLNTRLSSGINKLSMNMYGLKGIYFLRILAVKGYLQTKAFHVK